MRASCLVTAMVVCLAGNAVTLCAQQTTGIRHVSLTVAATSDEWTPTGLVVGASDYVIVRAAGVIRVGQYTGDVGANGSMPANIAAGSGFLEYKVGVEAGRPAGEFGLHVPRTGGELKLRVHDNRYEDNSGAFSVDVLIVPAEAIPPAVDPATAIQAGSSAGALSAVVGMQSFLRGLVTAEEAYFSDSAKYSPRIRDLKIRQPQGVVLVSLAPVPGAWSAVVRNPALPSLSCAISVNTPNPIDTAAGDGEPVCR